MRAQLVSLAGLGFCAMAAASAGCGGAGSAAPDASGDQARQDVADNDGAGDGGAGDGGDAGAPDAPAGPLAWPTPEHPAASDPWIAENHARIAVMRPRVLALNFVNGRTMADMHTLVTAIAAAFREGSRFHGYDDAAAPAALEYQIAYEVDLRDPGATGARKNSSLYPRESPRTGAWGLDYEKFFSSEFADRYGIADPADPSRHLTLCELSDKGLVHEVWIYGDADTPDVSAAEILAIMPPYDADGRRVAGAPMDRCAGNGCFDADDVIPAACTRTLRIGWVNDTRGVGCYMESTSHGIESFANRGVIPRLTPFWKSISAFDLDKRFGLPFDSWYVCSAANCLAYPSDHTVHYETPKGAGDLDPYVPTCGNAHFPPNARHHYDIVNPTEVRSTCKGWRQGGGAGGADAEELVSAADWKKYDTLAPDCTGAWLVWWWQNWPGRDAPARDDGGKSVPSFWPYLFY